MLKRCLNCMEEYEESQKYCMNCGWSEDEDGKGIGLEPGTILQGRYIVGTSRKSSKADRIYIGWDALFERKVLIMEYFPLSCVMREDNGSITVAGDSRVLFQSGMERFLKNAGILIEMDDTEGILNVFSSFQENNTAYMIWEYAGEKNLRNVFLEQGVFSLVQTERLVTKLSTPLLAACKNGICHGQLSMDRCYIRQDGNIAVGLFNDAGFITGDWNKSEMNFSTEKADIFELAYIVGAALNGVVHWEGRQVLECLNEMSERMPDYVIYALEDAMSVNQDEKPRDMRRFIDQFMDEATIEVPANRLYREDASRRGPLWNILHR